MGPDLFLGAYPSPQKAAKCVFCGSVTGVNTNYFKSLPCQRLTWTPASGTFWPIRQCLIGCLLGSSEKDAFNTEPLPFFLHRTLLCPHRSPGAATAIL